MDKQFDVIVVGGGMVGATVGCALGDTSLKVGVIEQSMPAAFKLDQPHDLRVSALSKASQAIFESLAVWPGIVERRACPYRPGRLRTRLTGRRRSCFLLAILCSRKCCLRLRLRRYQRLR